MMYTANILTACRIIVSVFILFIRPFTKWFYICYIFCGISDMADGYAARKTGSESLFGAKLDSAADIVFTAVCFIKILPVLQLKPAVLIWTAAIAILKFINIVYGYIRMGHFITPHTCANKAVGFLLFLLPLTVWFININYYAVLVCTAASFAAIHELFIIIKNKPLFK